mmetsp:Transcript_77868/g.223141  ORF Transcript_77868/g.223141 Transcript_77868/m.223141 type:complete len:214 (+) Transcript_77868:109-750(+)
MCSLTAVVPLPMTRRNCSISAAFQAAQTSTPLDDVFFFPSASIPFATASAMASARSVAANSERPGVRPRTLSSLEEGSSSTPMPACRKPKSVVGGTVGTISEELQILHDFGTHSSQAAHIRAPPTRGAPKVHAIFSAFTSAAPRSSESAWSTATRILLRCAAERSPSRATSKELSVAKAPPREWPVKRISHPLPSAPPKPACNAAIKPSRMDS